MHPFPDSAATRRAHREVLGLLAAAVGSPPPGRLQGSVMDGARRARPAGAAVSIPPRISPVDAFARIVDDLAELLDSLAHPDWGREVVAYGWTVKGLVAHLTAIDRYLATKLGIGHAEFDATLEHDHVEMTRAAVESADRAGAAMVVESWRSSAQLLVDHGSGLTSVDLQGRVGFHGLDARIATILVSRVFEVWTHADDIRRTLGRPPMSPAPDIVQEMARVAVPAIPLGMALRNDLAGGRMARLVLTGAGGGTFDQPLGLGEKPTGQMPGPDVVIVADVVDFCRLAAQRVSVADLDVHFEGDVDLGHRLLAGASVFAA
jgi:uncharacterized protein (TIGR03083 family)